MQNLRTTFSQTSVNNATFLSDVCFGYEQHSDAKHDIVKDRVKENGDGGFEVGRLGPEKGGENASLHIFRYQD